MKKSFFVLLSGIFLVISVIVFILAAQFTDTSDTDFNLGTHDETLVEGTGDSANVTLNISYKIDAVNFDGTNDWLNKSTDLTGDADSKVGIFSGWINIRGGDGGFGTILTVRSTAGGGTLGFIVERLNDDTLVVIGANTTPTTVLRMDTVGTYDSNSGWVHILASWDLANGKGWFYINDISDIAGGSTLIDDTIDYTKDFWGVGARADGSSIINADLADIYFNNEEFLNLSVASNRRKFITANGNPVDLGHNGTGPTGTTPIVFLRGDTAGFITNNGSGGGFTENGALANSSTTPGFKGNFTSQSLDAGSTSANWTTINWNDNLPNYTTDAVSFDGINDFLLRGADLTGSADGKVGTISLWINLKGADGANHNTIYGSNGFFYLRRNSADVFEVQGRNTASTAILLLKSATNYTTSSSEWLHVLASWNLSSGTAHLYVNDVEDLAASPTLTDDTLDYTRTEWAVGGNHLGTDLEEEDIADLWFDPTGYIDLSVESNRRKFIDENGFAVNLGSDGSTPTGTAPIVFLSGDTAGFITNKGTGEGFTENGSLANASSSPNSRLILNITTRTSDDNITYSEWSSVYTNNTDSTISQNNTARYLQYRAVLSTTNTSITPKLLDVTVNYTADTCTYTSGNWVVDCSDNCNITSNVDVGGNDIYINGTGTFVTQANITGYSLLHIAGTDTSNMCTVTCLYGGCFGP